MQIAGSRTLRRRKSRMTTLKPSAVAISGSRSLYSSVIVGIVLQIALEKPAPNRRVTHMGAVPCFSGNVSMVRPREPTTAMPFYCLRVTLRRP